ncbi:glycerophosphodiester phosphodiesterase [Evansella tamaricis]|uniref:Glycerophosphodiester phosphodiesterase n=1 Tax=Evansella tamaricis TaxID=2069301 RepID=A0ABS6JCA1_9BACI|nr:glycerophosphodiester phosphodiesterase family protein [Evansella tamaricis]MBU9711291.1 glycerophosphodiester phosphodiesterase [Evansella tamaricis]
MNPISAHRGWSSKAPENTLAAFQLALDTSEIESIEFDVQLTKDGIPVVIHDFTLERTTNGKGLVKEITYEELRKLDAGSWFSEEFAGEKVPTLEEVFQLIKGKKKLYLELKQAGIMYPGLEKKVYDLMDKYDMFSDTTVISFDHESLKRLKDMDNTVSTGLIIYGRPTLIMEQLQYTGASFIGMGYPFITAGLLTKLLESGVTIMCAPGDELQDIQMIMAMDSSIGISTNYPDRALEMRKIKTTE